ncbi:MAG: MOSC N-terminal beta barrel domain-containing protein [Pirellulales bacterium]|nr:MOSC N-terminal beta barrel domain-containing protein [Pirellulales bacterium]
MVANLTTQHRPGQPTSEPADTRPRLARIIIYPLKSLDGQPVDKARLIAPGALEFDRRWAITDAAGRFLSGKRTPLVHALRLKFDPQAVAFELSAGDGPQHTFLWPRHRFDLEHWLAAHFGEPVHVREHERGGLPDDTDLPGPTLISTASLVEVASWFGLTLDDTRRRFRANLEIDGVPAFWEDRLVGEVGQGVRFTIGVVQLVGCNPCQRCIVPSRDQRTSEAIGGFQREFARRREATLPAWAPRGRFNHFYRLAVNTTVPETSWQATLSVGDEVRIE